METILMGLKAQLDALSGKFDAQAAKLNEVTETMKELKTENTALRSEILGVPADGILKEECFGLLQTKTLREVVDKIEFEVNQLSAKCSKSTSTQKRPAVLRSIVKTDGVHKARVQSSIDNVEDAGEQYPAVEINCKTVEEERKWMKMKFSEVAKNNATTDGAGLVARSFKTISSSTYLYRPFDNPPEQSVSCLVKLSNFTHLVLTDPEFSIFDGRRTDGPSRIFPHISDLISFEGNRSCHFLYSFRLTGSLRLTFYCCNFKSNEILFGIGFTPEGVPTNQMMSRLWQISPMPDVWMRKKTPSFFLWNKDPDELFVKHRKFLARIHMTGGPQSVVLVDIMEVDGDEVASGPASATIKSVVDGNSLGNSLILEDMMRVAEWDEISCSIEITNCLNVALKCGNQFPYNYPQDGFEPSKILSFHREGFRLSDDTRIEAMFSYEIESTDIGVVIGVRAQENKGSFSAAFVQLPALTNADELASLMDEKEWKSHLYRTHEQANKGEQTIQIRNIRAKISMTGGERWIMKIRIFAV